jgi:hypothetical protein
MKRIKIAGLCLVAMFAFSAMIASASQAATYDKCANVGKKKGKYSEAACKTVAEKKGKLEGSFEIAPVKACENVGKKKGKYSEANCLTVAEKKGKLEGSFEKTKIPLEATSGPSTLKTPALGSTNVECTASVSKGFITGPKTAEESVEFTGCQLGGAPCESAGPEGTASGHSGTIDTNELHTSLLGEGETSKSGPLALTGTVPTGKVWTEIQAAAGIGAQQAEFDCSLASAYIRTHGSLSGETTVVGGPLSKKSEVNFVTGGVSDLETEPNTSGNSFNPADWVGPFASEQVQEAHVETAEALKTDE